MNLTDMSHPIGVPVSPGDILRLEIPPMVCERSCLFVPSAALHTALKLVQGDNTILIGVQLPEHILVRTG